MRRLAVAVVMVLPAGCASRPQLVMTNPRTGVTVECQMPDAAATSGQFLVSRACLSACQAHGFHPVPGAAATSADGDMPRACLN